MTTSPETDFWYPDPEEPEDIRKAKDATAKAICYSCPVQVQCLRYAIDTDEPYGIWGGLTARARATVRRQWENEGQNGG